MLIRVTKRFERIIVSTLMVLLMVVLSVATVELGWLLLTNLRSVGSLVLDVEEMLQLFGFFLLVLIGVELLTTLEVHLVGGKLDVEVVLEVTLIAVAQKVIVLDAKHANATTLLGLAALVLTLAVAFWCVRNRGRARGKGPDAQV